MPEGEGASLAVFERVGMGVCEEVVMSGRFAFLRGADWVEKAAEVTDGLAPIADAWSMICVLRSLAEPAAMNNPTHVGCLQKPARRNS